MSVWICLALMCMADNSTPKHMLCFAFFVFSFLSASFYFMVQCPAVDPLKVTLQIRKFFVFWSSFQTIFHTAFYGEMSCLLCIMLLNMIFVNFSLAGSVCAAVASACCHSLSLAFFFFSLFCCFFGTCAQQQFRGMIQSLHPFKTKAECFITRRPQLSCLQCVSFIRPIEVRKGFTGDGFSRERVIFKTASTTQTTFACLPLPHFNQLAVWFC